MSPTIRRALLVTAAVAGIAVLAVLAPPFHVVPLDRAREAAATEQFDAAQFADAFWRRELLPALPKAADARTVLDAVRKDPTAARERYGQTVGVSNSYSVFLQGTGRIVAVDSKGVFVSLQDGNPEPEILLPIGMIFGNTVRDATGLLDITKFPNSRDFNDISAALNRIVEERVLPRLRERAEVGLQARFVGCASTSVADKRRSPLKVIPLQVEVLTSAQPK